MRNRSVVIVIRDKKILMEKLYYDGRLFYSIPGGGIEEGETPEEAAIRELKEECGLDGVIVKKLAELYNNNRTEYSFEVRVPENQIAIKGYDPEEPKNNQPIKEVLWMDFLKKFYLGVRRLVIRFKFRFAQEKLVILKLSIELNYW